MTFMHPPEQACDETCDHPDPTPTPEQPRHDPTDHDCQGGVRGDRYPLTEQPEQPPEQDEVVRRELHEAADLVSRSGKGSAEYRAGWRDALEAVAADAALATPPPAPAALDDRCQHDDAGQPCGRVLDGLGRCSIHDKADWPNPDACCLRNAFEDDAHSPTCPEYARLSNQLEDKS